MRTALTSLILLIVSTLPAMAATSAAGAWVRWVPGQENAVGYMTLNNNSSSDELLVSATSPDFKTIELHEMNMDGDTMQMRRVNSIAVPAGGKVEFAPMDYHLMLIGLKQGGLKEKTVPVTLKFKSGLTQQVSFTLHTVGEKPAVLEMDPMHHDHGSH